ncbi:hypothetical protein BJV85_002881 [Clostridium acetobutylicum]|uniref:Uncharacterized protein n=1 Tax=Clostridium acetobutylicum (strain ATCC 824 / DSM 792 / JCM 1419 / IAM 19013 / LMG 5710 / NBRC 13948 / NRRL B-527 / VKM B-1787 / 2291 / W) TaxID=272562 RepID=Q97K05_CLOAB|nr:MULTISPECIES: hypothetical protein [Clostridium]AAK79090.1 Hypothetical protein CA_C1116 [Clostridium acetobutylicum ATCC 824]ADZ20166.1 Conserved hypothetical protein [Clostridium acetobutylicum EA 2018]AEI31628.1 hypothetical protein SMB_G1135 [Clostridium acetobutylicum DSM 1731]AWV81656.1 hypothetical protein DK921_16470 [Clostridium acetobutylicum]MBC2393302.1 hypothetical protein [Clostridium acetobutylicum]
MEVTNSFGFKKPAFGQDQKILDLVNIIRDNADISESQLKRLSDALNVWGSHNGSIVFYQEDPNKIYIQPAQEVVIRSSYSNGSHNSDAKLTVVGDLYVSGAKHRTVKTKCYGKIGLNAYETADCLFGDVGESKLVNGTSTIELDKVFLETVNTKDCSYQVFLTKYGKGDIWVEERNPTNFTVKGTTDIKFTWEIKAKQKYYEKCRLPEIK